MKVTGTGTQFPYEELGFPIMLVDPPMITVRGQRVPAVNLKELQEVVFGLLIEKPERLSGAEVRFVRKHLRLRQADLATVLNMANHSVVSQWESKEAGACGMDYNTEVVLRVWMAIKAGQGETVPDLLESKLKGLKPATAKPMQIKAPRAA